MRFDRDERHADDVIEEVRPRRRRARDLAFERPEDEQFGFRYDEAPEMRERPERDRRPERRALREEGLSEARVTRILDDAFEAMQHTLRLNEDRTAEAIESLARRLEDRRADNRVRAMQSGIERDFGRSSDEDRTRRERRARRDADIRDDESQESRHEARHEFRQEPRYVERAAPPAEEPRPVDRVIEQQLQALGERIDGLVRHVVAKPVEAPAPVRSDTESLERLRAEVARLNAAQVRPQPQTDQLVHALRELDAKVGRLAAPAEQGYTAVAGHLHSLGERLDAIADKVASMRLSGPRDLRSQRAVNNDFAELKRLITQSAAPSDDRGVLNALQSLERRLEALDRPQPALTQTFDRVQAIEKKLDLIQHAPQELNARLAQLNRLETLERKLDAMQGAPNEISARLDEICANLNSRPPESHHAAGVEAALGALAARVERLHQDRSEQEALRRLQDEVQAISQKMDLAAGASQGEPEMMALDRIRSIETKLDMLQEAPSELARRLDQIQYMMQQAPASAGVPQGFETLLRNLALRLESIQTSPADDGTLDRLHQDIRQISQRLEASPAAGQMQGVADLGNLERSISELFGQLQQLRGEMGTTAAQAARMAAGEVISQAPLARESAPDELVRRQLSEIHVAQQEAERRSNETLGAVHETLTRVVDRLVDLEKDVKIRPRVEAAAPLPQAAQAPLQTQPLPPLGADPAAITLPARASGLPDGQAPSTAALRSQRLGVSLPTAQEVKPSGIGQMLAAARDAVTSRKRDKEKDEAAPPMLPPSPARPAAAPATAAPDLALDMPLEPGSGRPRPGQHDMAAGASDPKANFLAAARRAAQAAAEQSAEALAQNGAVQKGGRKPAAAGRKGLSKKQVILLGLAAVVVAVGASVQVMQAPPKVEPQPDKLSNLDRLLGRQAPSETAGASKTAQGSSTQAAPTQTGALPGGQPAAGQTAQPRQIVPLDATAQARQEDRVALPSARTTEPAAPLASGDPSIVGSISTDPQKAPDAAALARQPLPAVSNDPLMRFEGIAGAERLKAAARAGDTAAFIELGNRHLEGRGAPRDPRTAALWFERAADAGSAAAKFRLGAMYREGRGLERNPKLAYKHFQAAAEAGNARAMYNAAVLLAEGINGAPDYATAGEWFKKAAEFGIRDSQYNLAILYARGLGVPQDLVASYAWFAAAAASGDEDAGKKRDEVAARLAPDKLAQAKAAAAAWKAKVPDPAANEILQPPGGWDASAGAKQVPAAALGKTGSRVN
jgi:localization factor PodJL